MSRCTCPVQFPMIKISDGKYRVGDSDTLIFVRVSPFWGAFRVWAPAVLPQLPV